MIFTIIGLSEEAKAKAERAKHSFECPSCCKVISRKSTWECCPECGEPITKELREYKEGDSSSWGLIFVGVGIVATSLVLYTVVSLTLW